MKLGESYIVYNFRVNSERSMNYMNESFIDILKENDEDKMREWISSYGKKAKAVSPIYFFYDLTPEDQLKEEDLYDIKVKERSCYV
jgi:hypothetical protein